MTRILLSNEEKHQKNRPKTTEICLYFWQMVATIPVTSTRTKNKKIPTVVIVQKILFHFATN